jgi:DNA-binding SARP family transcriptional activator
VLDIHLFGPLLVEHQGRALGPRDFGGVKPKQLLEILLLERGHPVPKDRLADLLWGEKLPRKIAATLETYVSVLRRNLQPGGPVGSPIVTEPGAYRFDVRKARIDLDRFDQLIDLARKERGRVSRRCLEEAITLVRGELIEDEPYAPWAEEQRHHYHERFLQALLDASEAALADGDLRVALGHANHAVKSDRLSERAYRLSMLAAYGLGRQEDALRAYDRCRKVLAAELGVSPLPDTVAVFDAIARHDDVETLLPRPSAAPIEVHTSGAPSEQLLGRTRELATLEDRIQHALEGSFALVFVEGEAGIGKSRVLAELVGRMPHVRAGLARCSELERDLPYVPFAAAFRQVLAGLAISPSNIPELAAVLPEARQPHSNGSAVDAFEAIVDLVARYAPMLLVLDDAHFADAGTLAAISYLQRRCASLPLAIIAAYRPELAGSEHPLRRIEPTLRLTLGALTAPDLAATGVREIHEQTGGHPLFVAAVLGAKRGTGRGIDELRDLVTERCRMAGEQGRRVLAAASVLAEPFDPEPVARAIDLEPTTVVEEMEKLCDHGFLRVDNVGFAFRQAAMREILAAGLSPARRRLLIERASDLFVTERGSGAPIDEHGFVIDLKDAVTDVLTRRVRARENVED